MDYNQPNQPNQQPYNNPYPNVPQRTSNLFTFDSWKDCIGFAALIAGAASLLFSCCSASASIVLGTLGLIVSLVCMLTKTGGKKEIVMIALIVSGVGLLCGLVIAFLSHVSVDFINMIFGKIFIRW